MSAIANYGYQALFVALFLEAAGLPIPGAVVLLAAGAAVAGGAMSALLVLPVAVAAMVSADALLYFAGRYSGWGLLSVMCGLSLSPESCILQSAKWFYRRGRIALLVTKFIPGVNSIAPPLAGSMKMRGAQFIGLDIAGALAYVLTYGVIGYLFSGMLDAMVRGLVAFRRSAEWLIGAAIVVYLAYRIWLYGKHRLDRSVRRVPVSQVAASLMHPGSCVIADVRSHGYYDAGAQRVRGSIRLEPNNLDGALGALSKDVPIYLYCS